MSARSTPLASGLSLLGSRHRTWARRPACLLENPRIVLGVVIQVGGSIESLGGPVDGDVGEELILGVAALDISVAVTPFAVSLNDPRGEPRRRVIQCVGEGLGLGPLHVEVRPVRTDASAVAPPS